MPGALVYTDDNLNIVFCNDQFRKMYPAPPELLQPGRPYPAFLRYLAENGYYGEGDLDELVARRVESLRNPACSSFVDRSPDGQFYRVLRRRALRAAGGPSNRLAPRQGHARPSRCLQEGRGLPPLAPSASPARRSADGPPPGPGV